MFALDGVLARSMEVELDKLVVCVSNGKGIAFRIVDLDGVTVVDNLERRWLIVDLDRSKRRWTSLAMPMDERRSLRRRRA